MKTPATGSCQCGAVNYTLNTQPLFTYACHCHTCQKRTGGACSVALVVLSDALDVQGELTQWKRTSDKGDTNTRYSCACCGNVIYGIGETSPELAKLQSGTLDDTTAVEPEVHMWTSSKQSWISLAPEVGQFETQPDDPLALLQAALDYRATKNPG
jgi:hypothetical protein